MKLSVGKQRVTAIEAVFGALPATILWLLMTENFINNLLEGYHATVNGLCLFAGGPALVMLWWSLLLQFAESPWRPHPAGVLAAFVGGGTIVAIFIIDLPLHDMPWWVSYALVAIGFVGGHQTWQAIRLRRRCSASRSRIEALYTTEA